MNEAEKLRETRELVRKGMNAGLEIPDEDLEKDILRAAYIPDGDKAGEALKKMMDKIRRDEKVKAIKKALDAATESIRVSENDPKAARELVRQQEIYLIVDHCGFSTNIAESFIKMGMQADEAAGEISKLAGTLKYNQSKFFATLTTNNERRKYGAPMISSKRYRHEKKKFSRKDDKQRRRG